MQAAEGVCQAVSQHSVLHRDVTHTRAPSRFLDEIRSHRHALRTAGQHDFRVTGLYHLCSQADRPQTRSAHLIYSKGRNLLRNTRSHSRQPRHALSLARLENTAEYNLVDLVRRNSGAGHRFFHRCLAELNRCHTV